MDQIISTKVKINQKLTMQQIMDLFEISKDYSGNIYFICNNRAVEPERLSKLVSFMLTLQECTNLKVLVEGENAEAIMNKVKQCCSPDSYQAEAVTFMVHSNRKTKI